MLVHGCAQGEEAGYGRGCIRLDPRNSRRGHTAVSMPCFTAVTAAATTEEDSSGNDSEVSRSARPPELGGKSKESLT